MQISFLKTCWSYIDYFPSEAYSKFVGFVPAFIQTLSELRKAYFAVNKQRYCTPHVTVASAQMVSQNSALPNLQNNTEISAVHRLKCISETLGPLRP